MNTFKRNIFITVRVGFISSHVERLFVNKYSEYKIIDLNNQKWMDNVTSGYNQRYYEEISKEK